MADNRNFAALDWLIREINETLKEARQSLENYVLEPTDSAQLRFCLTHIHQVHGSLQMVEFYGASLLAHEMELLTQAMIQESVVNKGEAQEVLMRAILQFPTYLDQVKTTRKDNPLVVLPLLNDIRAVRGESLLTDTKLFVPNIAPAKKISGQRLAVTRDNVQFQAMCLKLRQMYQYAASGFIKGVNPDENLAYLRKAFTRLQKLTSGTARFALWDIAVALVEALELDAVEISVAIKNLLRQLDKEIKVLAVSGSNALDQFTDEELIKNLLYYVARAGKHTPSFPPQSHLKYIFDLYHLDDALVEGRESDDQSGGLNAPDSDAIRSVVSALKEELGYIKNALDVCLSGGHADALLSDALPTVKRVADTLAVLGFGDLRKRMLEQGEALEVATQSTAIDTDSLLAIAGELISIENTLDNISEFGANEVREHTEGELTLTRAKEAVLRESRTGLEHAKDAIIEYIASQWNSKHLADVPSTLYGIRGGLEMMPLPRPANILSACARYIEEQLLTNTSTPQWSSLDTLADAITSIEYYLERISNGNRKEEDELLLDVAEESMSRLGYTVIANPRPFAETVVAEKRVAIEEAEAETEAILAISAAMEQFVEPETANALSEAQTTLEPHVEMPSEEIVQEPVTTEALDITGHDTSDRPENTIDPDESTDVAPVDNDALIAITSDDEDKSSNEVMALDNSLAVEDESNAEPNLIATNQAPVIQRDDGDIDDEIVEIFVEEAAEVLETIQRYFPRWVANQDDNESLTEFRRAFHTLKGSGRMVGANEVGELAWSVENLLNRIIDGTVTATTLHVAFIERVTALVPDMIEAFHYNIPNPHYDDTERLREWGLAMAQGIEVPELAAALALPAESMVEAPAAEDDIALEVTEPVAEDVITIDDDAVNADELVSLTVADELSADTPTIDDETIETIDAPSIDDDAIPTLAADDDIDVQLWEIFGAESTLHLQLVQQFIDRQDADAPFYTAPSEDLQRALHTLKGSAHMAGIGPIAELATPLERLMKELRAYQINLNDDLLQLLRDGVSYTQIALGHIARHEPIDIPRLAQYIARVEELRDIHVAPVARLHEAETQGKQPVDPELLDIFMAEEMNLLLDADKIIAVWQLSPDDVEQLAPISAELAKLAKAASHASLPPLAELSERLLSLYKAIMSGAQPSTPQLGITLTQTHNALLDMVDAIAAGQNLQPIPAWVIDALNDVESPHHASDDDETLLLDETLLVQDAIEQDHALDTLDLIDEDGVPTLALTDSEDDIPVLMEAAHADEDLPLLLDDLEEADVTELILAELPIELDTQDQAEGEILLDDEDALSLTDDEPFIIDDVIAPLPVEDDEIITLSDTADIEPVLDHTLAAFDPMADDEVLTLEDDAALTTEPADEILLEDDAEDITTLFDTEAESFELVDEDTDDTAVDTSDRIAETSEPLSVDVDAPVVVTSQPLPSVASPMSVAPLAAAWAGVIEGDFDPEIVEIFLDEATELLDDIDSAISEWQDNWHNLECAESLKRSLHTFKGGARLAGLTQLGDQSHDFETMLMDMDEDAELTAGFFAQLHAFQDQLHHGVETAKQMMQGGLPSEPAQVNMPVPEQPIEQADETPDDANSPESETATTEFVKPHIVVDNTREVSLPISEAATEKPNVLAFAPKVKPVAPPTTTPAHAKATAAQPQHLAARRQGPQEVIKVSADLLEELVNLAGETAISRGRMEQQVGDLSHAIDEMEFTIHRMQEQLRRLDIETEAQILFRQEQMAQQDDFDPLEMDRYSSLQQLARSLMESASDLMDLKLTLTDKTRDAETLLLQQSRINTDLQEGLMRSRMVPFSRLVPRLRRIVRQAAAELGKEVNFELSNVEGELDRTVLERMVAPLEHMLRNAVDHGIETADERLASGKSDTGRIQLSLSREGGEVILRLSDDGRGIDIERVRAKAIERGLITAETSISDAELIQFILHAGFSTAEQVTQISGRGVGMDVVHAEIKQLGGAMYIDSLQGQGVTFTVRLPFTVSVNRALMVQIGEDYYAIPLNTIEGIVRVSPFELEHYYQDPDSRFDYAGVDYHMRYLGTFLESDAQPKLDSQLTPLPVVLVRSLDHAVALQVDRLLGSREIVVKTLGPQFSGVRGLSGATVMGDGSVVVILDLHALIRENLSVTQALSFEPITLAAPAKDAIERTVMVVDDSVTVRKVTTRFLEREGYHVITAKDGVEALQLLQDKLPDLMLLDIEMPRMDGFEVAKNIRTSSRMKGLPIIMITSRTGEKHRERALSLGVNRYMGKPYQEELLLNTIKELLPE